MGQAVLDDLEVALGQNRWVREILERFEEIALPDAWLVAGSIAQTVWNLGCGQRAQLGLKDVDLIYFDGQDLSFDAEASHERRLRDLFRRLPIKLDVKTKRESTFGTKSALAMQSSPTFPAPTRSQPFQPLQLAWGYVGYAANWSVVPPSDLTICSASLSDPIKGR
jgi:hypothetical protein